MSKSKLTPLEVGMKNLGIAAFLYQLNSHQHNLEDLQDAVQSELDIQALEDRAALHGDFS